MKRPFRANRTRPPLWAGGLALALALAPLACKPAPKTVKVVMPEGEAPTLASTVRTSEASQEPQLLSGFYGVENNSWRWTARQFSVLLRTPIGGSQSGATLDLAFTIPQVAIDHSKSLTLSVSVEGTPLPSETFNKSGPCEYRHDVPPSALRKDAVRVQFSLDKAMPPSGADRRELGVIVASVGLEPK